MAESLEGGPVFEGTDVPIEYLHYYLDKVHNLYAFLDDYPSVTLEQSFAAIEERLREDLDNVINSDRLYQSGTPLRKFAAYPRQHELDVALREIGRVERTLFIVDWLLDADMQRRAKTGLNRGEAHHALNIWRQGEIRDRVSEGQHYRMAGLNLLAAIINYWNTAHLGEEVGHRKHAGLTVEPELLAQISPLGWAHILLTGEYRWPKRR